MEHNAVDLGIIGGGPAGYVAAERAADRGLSVALFEKGGLGGVCLHRGCIPTKALLHAAHVASAAHEAETYGIRVGKVEVDYGAVCARKDKVVGVLEKGIEAAMKKRKVAVVKARAVIRSRGSRGVTVEAGGAEWLCRNLLVATGSRPVLPPVEGMREGTAMTSADALSLDAPPARLVIVGGGFIGLEFASFFSAVGSSVTVVEMLEEIAPGMDREIAGILRRELARRGVSFRVGCRVTGMEEKGTVRAASARGKEERIEGDAVLVCVGRRPVVEDFGLENLCVEVKNGAVVTDDRCRTAEPAVYAAGDVNGKSMLAHTASREAEVAVDAMCGGSDRMRYHAVPSVVYTHPEAASVGYTEEELKEEGAEYASCKLPMGFSGRFRVEYDRMNGVCKILVEKGSRRILGVHMVGGPCSEMIYGAALMVEHELRVEDVREIIFPHPTVSEIIRETLFSL